MLVSGIDGVMKSFESRKKEIAAGRVSETDWSWLSGRS
jgi:hypothetical protein